MEVRCQSRFSSQLLLFFLGGGGSMDVRVCSTYCLPTAAHAASVWFGCAGKVRSRGRHSGSVAVIVADM